MAGFVGVSIVIAARNEGHNLKQTIDHLAAARVQTPFELLVVDDASTDNSVRFLKDDAYLGITLIKGAGLGPCAARNLGVAHCRGDVIVFMDGHVIVNKGWLDALTAPFTDPGIHALVPVLGAFSPSHPDVYGLTLDHNLQPVWRTRPVSEIAPVPLAGAGCLAIRRETFEAVGQFDEGLRGIGSDDLDLCLKLWTLGYNVYLNPQARVLHNFRSVKPYPVDIDAIYYNYLRVCFKHFSEPRLVRAINTAKAAPNLGQVMMDLLASDVWQERADLAAARVHDDDWWFDTFGLGNV